MIVQVFDAAACSVAIISTVAAERSVHMHVSQPTTTAWMPCCIPCRPHLGALESQQLQDKLQL